MKENGFWRRTLSSNYWLGLDPVSVLAYDDLVNGLTSELIREAAQKHFDMGNYARFVLYPEKATGEPQDGSGNPPDAINGF